eukprot:13617318-Alexandrium_andersonii.AAC.1
MRAPAAALDDPGVARFRAPVASSDAGSGGASNSKDAWRKKKKKRPVAPERRPSARSGHAG